MFACFDKTITVGGKEALQYIFYHPSYDLHVIQSRQQAILACLNSNLIFPFDRGMMEDLSKYWRSAFSDADRKNTLWSTIALWEQYSASFYYKKCYIQDTVQILRQLDDLLVTLDSHGNSNPILAFENIQLIVRQCLTVIVGNDFKTRKMKVSRRNIHIYDENIRVHLTDKMQKILEFIYDLDAYTAIAATAKKMKLTFPRVHVPGSLDTIEIEGLYHIFYEKSVNNDISFERQCNLWFLTGANMAGKSTLIKALSIAIYLTHIGLPVPARSMHTPVLDGLYTTINLPDNLEAGYSHFYHEAIRLRDIIDQLESNSNSFIVLDELFTGTNYQDACASTKKVVQYLTKLERPFIIISSHLTELVDGIKAYPNVQLYCMKTELAKNEIPKFTYQLGEGVANEKLGLWLLERSGLLDAVEELMIKNSRQ
ncbi:hypothetical protein M8998_15120 [Sphingobacterium sp. lm-10]|nr:hypothetical protein [Sphingobacterium sp. lm-10]